jgi:predicted RecA/RadA family phage recombinase
MTATGADTFFESDGKAVTVTASYAVTKGQVAYAQGWLGLANRTVVSGEDVALTIDRREYQFTVPSSLTVHKGDDVYVDITDLTGHTPDDSSYYTATGSNRVKLFKATADKDGNNMVTGILYPFGS